MINIEQTGPLALLQDLGRPGYAHLGVSPSGAADRTALRLANRMLGNQENDAAIECLGGGLTVRATALHWVVVTGAPTEILVNGVANASHTTLALRPGDRLAIRPPTTGLRSYLAVRGGFAAPSVLGSRSTDVLSGLGPDPLSEGQELSVGHAKRPHPDTDLVQTPRPRVTLQLQPGPRRDWFTDEAWRRLLAEPWTVSPDSNRIAVRLDGPGLPRADGAELPSEGLVRGAVQVPASGQPLIFGADHPVTGGYPVIAVLTGAIERRRGPTPPRAASVVRSRLQPSTVEEDWVSIRKVLVANRGEIAVRVIRAARDNGLPSVAVYAEPDADGLFVQLADEAYALSGATPAETYLDVAKLLDVARRSDANAIHPGYGFLAENAGFAAAVLDAGLIWIGPPPAAIEALGDKVQARHIAQKVGAPLVPGTADPVADAAEVRAFAEEHGLPIAIKAAYGGGGRGLKVARELDEIEELFESATREAVSAFGRGECFVERYLDHPRHVETQCLADTHGNVVVVSTRDCSLQRRHQKLVEEAPAPFLSSEQLTELYAASKAILAEAGYVGAGTCEFLVGTDGTISFLEVNTRLQVEHPVSEEVTGLDLVQEMFRIANGEPLGYDDPEITGHAIEFRLNAEDAGRNFLPAPGTLTELATAGWAGVRVDEGYLAGMTVPGSFDSLIAKIIVSGADREQALARSRRALAELVIEGMPTVLPFHRAVLDDPAFTAPDGRFGVHTRWIETEFDNALEPYAGPAADSPEHAERTTVRVEVNGKRLEVSVPAAFGTTTGPAGRAKRPPRRAGGASKSSAPSGNALTSPMQGTVVKVAVADGDTVAAGDLVVVLEAMKMEQPLTAHRAGTVTNLSAEVGSTVTSGSTLCEIVDASEQQLTQ